MSIDATASAAQGPEVGSDEWVAQKLQALGTQGEEPDASDPEEAEQGDAPEATATAAAQFSGSTATAAPSWRDVVIPLDDETVPQHFRGKPVVEYENSRRELERQWNEDRRRMRELEAKVAAKETFRELLAEQQRAAAPTPTPSDSYRAAGIDLETDPVLNPTKFFPKQEQLILEKAKQLVAEELAKRDAEAQRYSEEQNKVQRVAAALGQIEKQRGLTEAQMKQRIPSIMMTAGEQLGPEALADPDALLRIHDSIFGAPPPQVALQATAPVPNPPGVKRPSAVEPAPKNTGPQLKQYEREILDQTAEEILSMRPELNGKFDMDRLRARYAVNIKRARG